MKKNIKLAEKIINKRFSKNDETYGLYILSCYGLLSKFGENYTPLIENLFQNTNFYTENKTLQEILLENNTLSHIPVELETENTSIIAVSFFSDDLFFNEYGKVIHKKTNPKIFCSTLTQSKNDILNVFTHEASHLIKGAINNVTKEPYNSFTIRCGLNTVKYYIENEDIYTLNKNRTLDEIINVFQVSDIMSEIKKLTPEELPKEARSYFQELDLNTLDDPYGYDFFHDICLPLWQNEHFKTNIEDHIITGELDEIANDFDKIVDSPLFEDFSYYLDCIEIKIENNEEIYELVEWIISTIKIYLIKTQKAKEKTI